MFHPIIPSDIHSEITRRVIMTQRLLYNVRAVCHLYAISNKSQRNCLNWVSGASEITKIKLKEDV